GAGVEGEAPAPDRVAVDVDHGVVADKLPRDELVRLEQRHHLLDAGIALEREAGDLLALADRPDHGRLAAVGDMRRGAGVLEHAELAWLLGHVASVGQLRRMTQFKDKSHGQESVAVDLFTYPVLQAADILLYDTDRVPVGDDQRQHVELARDVAQRFNNRFGETFKVPKGVFPDVGARIMDLQEPTKKMSTTGGTPQGTVLVLDEPDTIRKTFKTA